MDNDQVLELCKREALMPAAELFGALADTLEYIDISENVVYSYMHGGEKRILRLTHRGGRSSDQITAELDWLEFLSSRGAPVQKPIQSRNGRFVETVSTSEMDFHATSFTWVQGRKLEDEDITDDVIRQWGKTIGSLHRLTKDYRPADGRPVRFRWDEDDDIVNMEKYLPEGQETVIAQFRVLLDKLNNLPADSDSFGLIHSDAHYGNFFWDNGRINLFDFDDCFYTWFALDFATVWYWALHLPQGEANMQVFINHFSDVFMDGYRTENSIDQFWLDQIPLFLQYQEMLLYIYFYRISDADQLDEDERTMIEKYRKRIENGTLWFGRMNTGNEDL